jgi:beta-glucosidase
LRFWTVTGTRNNVLAGTFEYSDIRLDKTEMTDTEELRVGVTVKNTGKRAGKEIVQLYVRDKVTSVIRPVKELKGFEKVDLKPGEEKQVDFTLGKRAFTFYDTDINDWRVESGDFGILAGKSSEDILCLRITSNTGIFSKTVTKSTKFCNWL